METVNFGTFKLHRIGDSIIMESDQGCTAWNMTELIEGFNGYMLGEKLLTMQYQHGVLQGVMRDAVDGVSGWRDRLRGCLE